MTRSKEVPAASGPSRAPASEPGQTGARYSIRVTSRLTSIEIDTLRVWERRYGFPRPERTSGGSRVYSEADVEVLRLIRRALEHGYRPGEVVGKSREELVQLVLVTSQAPPAPSKSPTPTVASLLATVAREDVTALRGELRQAATVLGPKGFLVEVAHPLSVRVGDLWAEGKLEVRHEHVLSECLSTQLQLLAAGYEDRPTAPRVLLATLPNERHGLGLEMVAVYLAVSMATPVLLGVDTPPEQIVRASHSHAVDAVGLLVTQASDPRETAQHIRWMLGELPRRVSIWVGGAAGPDVVVRNDAFRVVSTWADLDEAIAALPWRTT